MAGSLVVMWSMAGAIVVLGTAVIALAIGQRRLGAALRRDAQRLFEQVDLALGELHGVGASLSGCRQGLDELRARATPAAGPAASAPALAPSRSYDIALRLARNGASREELMSSCGMSRHEAGLAVRLHGPGQRGRPLRSGAAA